jgi:HK97 family phage major capsid protein
MNATAAKAAMRDLGAKAQAVVDDGTLTPAEKMTRLDAYQADLKRYQDEVSISEKAAALGQFGSAELDAAEASAKAATPDKGRETKTLGQYVIESEAFKSAKANIGSRFSFSSELGAKTAATIGEGTTIANGQLNGAGGVLSLPNYLPGIVDIRFAPLSVADLFASGSTSSPIISYVKQASETVGAAATAEQGLKPQSDTAFVRLNEQVGKIAAIFKITDEMIQDYDQAQSFMTNRLVAQVQREEEAEVLNGTGYPSLNGILGRSGFQTTISAGTTGTLANPLKFAEAIHQQVTAIRQTAFVEPDAVVMNPYDWQYLQLAKDANSQYFSGGPFTGSYGNGGISNVAALWGLRVVQSPRIASGTALVGAFREAGQLFRRQGVTVEMTNSNEDDFTHNLITVRAESRSALVVYRPGAFGKVTVTWA